MRSLIHLYNAALAELGGEQIPTNISSLEQGTVGAICQNMFPHILDVVLESYEWGFAKKRMPLAMLSQQEGESSAYHIRYALPNDCIRLIQVFVPRGIYQGGIDYELEGACILCNVEQAVLLYVARITDPQCFPAYFAEVLKWKMASELATARNNDKQQKQLCEQQYERQLARACAMDRARQHKGQKISSWQAFRKGLYESNSGR